MADWVLAAERAYVARAVGAPPVTAAVSPDTAADPDARARALAAAAAVASRYLAVGTPRSFSIIIDDATDADSASLALTAHHTWFAPRDIRCAAHASGADQLAAATGGRIVSLAEALACDIVNVYSQTISITPSQLRRGTHVNLLRVTDRPLASELYQLATIVRQSDLPALAAGLVDGRQLDEITIFLVETPSALAASPAFSVT